MMIPNKFNGYSRDGVRLYNDPTMVVATIANMGEGAAAAAAIAEAAAAAAAAETATTAASTAAAEQAAAAQAAQAGQAGIMQGAAVPPPGVTPPGMPGLGAPMPPATPLPPAGVDAMGVPDVASGGINPAGQDQVAYANTEQFNVTNSAQPRVEQLSESPGPFSNVNAAVENTINPPVTGDIKPISAIERGARGAYDVVSKFAKENPITSLGGVMTAQKMGIFGGNDNGPKKEEYKRTPYAGLSPDFQPGGPSKYLYGFADGGITGVGPVEQMSNMNAIGGNEMYPMANIPRLEYANPVQQRPVSENIMTMGGDAPTDPYTGELRFSEGGHAEEKEAAETAAQRKRYSQMMGNSETSPEDSLAMGQSIASRAHGKSASITGHGIIPRSRAQILSSPNRAAQSEVTDMLKKYGIKAAMPKVLDVQSGSAGAGESDYANGGIAYGLGGYSDGGRLLKGPGDGVSDSIPATIGNRQPARLADGEFVIPARIVSELGNGSTEAGARQLYAMMERIQKGRKKSVGKGKVAVDSKAKKHLPG